MDTRIVQYYRLCGVIPVTIPPYAQMQPSSLQKIFTNKHVEIMLNQRNGLFYPKESVIGGRPQYAAGPPVISVFTD